MVVAAYNLFDVMYAMLIYYAGSYHSRESQRILGTRLTEREHDKKKRIEIKKKPERQRSGLTYGVECWVTYTDTTKMFGWKQNNRNANT